MIPSYVVLNKKRGETPLEAITIWKTLHPAFAEVRATYAGRLDPMAEGKLIVLLGEECKRARQYTKLDKEYVVQIVLDLSTDTLDLLGLPSYGCKETNPTRAEVLTAITPLLGTHVVPYPPFSSKTVAGKPLFVYALEGTLDTISIPAHQETLYAIKIVEQKTITKASLEKLITGSLSVVPRSEEPSKALGADFRQDIIRAGWRALLSAIPERDFTVITLRVTSGSGAYMRTLADRIAKELDTTACALSISRTKIGRYRKLGPLHFWSKKY